MQIRSIELRSPPSESQGAVWRRLRSALFRSRPDRQPRPPVQIGSRADLARERLLDAQLRGAARRRF